MARASCSPPSFRQTGQSTRKPHRNFDSRDQPLRDCKNSYEKVSVKVFGPLGSSTDDLGYDVAQNPVSIHNLHATMLHQFGIEHQRLSYQLQGLDFEVSGVEESGVVREILA